MNRYRLLQMFLVSALVTLQACGGGGSSNSDSGPTGPVPVPTPAPEPTPLEDPPLSASCARLGQGVPDSEAVCTDGPPNFLDEMNDAITEVRGTHPDWFDNFNVLNVGAFYVEIIRILDREGLCAATDGEEVGVKLNDDYNDQFDILSARSEVRSGPNIYIGTCAPAVFPVGSRALWPVPEGCGLPASTYVACGRPESRYSQDVEDAIDQMMAEHPELFDYTDINAGTDWPRVTDPRAYQLGVVDLLVQKGYCAIFDGEEITMKATNEFSEHYDINVADKYVRRGNGAYRGACYPSAF